MAEAIVAEIVSAIAEKLGSQAYKEIKSVRELDSHIQRLQELKTTIEATILDANSLESCSNAQQDVLDKLSCALVELDDFLDEKAAKANQKELMEGNKLIKEVRLFFSESNQFVSSLRDAHKLKAIVAKFECIARDHAQFGAIISIPYVNQTRALSNQTTSSHIITDIVIGRDKDRDNIINMLSDSISSEIPSVASIVGIGGVGKTTLAQYVYHDERVTGMFDACFWVSTSRDFNVIEVLEKVLRVALGVNEIPPNCEMDLLYDRFLRAIGGKKFLLVLDNVWDQDGLRLKWLQLRKLLAFGANGSKVLITTRFRTVAGIMDSVRTYSLEDLTEDNCWLLFQEIAFTEWQEPGVEVIGQEIARMCPKIPLVIRSIGGLLAGKRTLQEWQAFRDDQLANFSSYGRDIMQMLKLSFDQLDIRLKLCVAYCSLFPKEFQYDKSEMIRLWISLGYIEPQYSNQNLEETGEAYIQHLINCNFFKIHYSDIPYSGTSFKVYLTMHDLMHDLVLSVAGFKYKMIDSNTDEVDERVRHVSFGDTMSEDCWEGLYFGCTIIESEASWEVPPSLFRIKHLQSFLLTVPSYCKFTLQEPLSVCDKLITRFSCLRVLDLHDLGIKNVPRSLGELRCLRYLNLSRNPIVKLPKSITQLVNLLSLDLFDCYKLKELPKDMGKLMKLRYLYIKRCDALSHMPKGFSNLTELRTLDTFIFKEKYPQTGGLAELNHLDDLTGGLKISMSTNMKEAVNEAEAANLRSKDRLSRLHLEFINNGNRNDDEMVIEGLHPSSNLQELVIDSYGGEKLPSWMTDQLNVRLPNLVHITIYDCQGLKSLCSFGRLPNLKKLYLLKLDNVEYIEETCGDTMEEPYALFPSLEALSLEGLPKMKGWWNIINGDEDSRPPLQNDIIQRKLSFPRLRAIWVDKIELLVLMTKEFRREFDTQQISRYVYCSMMLMHRLQEATDEDWHEIKHNIDVCVSPSCRKLERHTISEGNRSRQEYDWFNSILLRKGKKIIQFH